MGPDHDLLVRIRGGLARVRWENVALLLLVVLAVAGVAISGALAGHGASPLPDDVGVHERSPRPDEAPRPYEHKTQKKAATMKKKRRTRMHHRIRHHAPTRDPQTPLTPAPFPPPPSPSPGSEFAPG